MTWSAPRGAVVDDDERIARSRKNLVHIVGASSLDDEHAAGALPTTARREALRVRGDERA